MEEIWKDVIGYEGLYKINNKGELYSFILIQNMIQKKQELSLNKYVMKHMKLQKNFNLRMKSLLIQKLIVYLKKL